MLEQLASSGEDSLASAKILPFLDIPAQTCDAFCYSFMLGRYTHTPSDGTAPQPFPLSTFSFFPRVFRILARGQLLSNQPTTPQTRTAPISPQHPIDIIDSGEEGRGEKRKERKEGFAGEENKQTKRLRARLTSEAHAERLEKEGEKGIPELGHKRRRAKATKRDSTIPGGRVSCAPS